MKVKTPGPCPKCKAKRRLNVLQFLCDCPTGNNVHSYLAHQFPVYEAAPKLLDVLHELVEAVDAHDSVDPRNSLVEWARMRDAVHAAKAVLTNAKKQ